MEAGHVTLELPPQEGNLRNSEGSFVTMKDGRILLAYTRFIGGGGDHSPAIIAGRWSSDRGETWSGDQTLVENEGDWNVMSVTLLRLADGRVAILYMVKNDGYDCRARLRFSSDEGASWSAPVDVIPEAGYYVVNNDRMIQLRSGRLIIPSALHVFREEGDPPKARIQPGRAMFFLSDDAGRTWRRSPQILEGPADSRSGLQEPGVIELADGTLFAWSRTDTGCQLGMWSSDGGETWTQPAKTSFISPTSPMSMKRIDSTGHLLAIWNDHSGRFPIAEPAGRQPMVSAISRDEGRTWENHKQVESDLSRGYHYTAIHFTDDAHVLLEYCAGPRKPGAQLATLRVRRLPLAWFYEC